MTGSSQYSIYYCPVHSKTIYYFKKDSHIQGKYHCFDCINDENKQRRNRLADDVENNQI
jgi:hypothetical protein